MKEYLNKIYTGCKFEFYNLMESNLSKKKKMNIITVNPEAIIMSKDNNKMKNILLNDEYYKTPDGIAVVKACNKNNINIKARITGVDIAEHLLNLANTNKYSIYLFGAKDFVIKELVEIIKQEYPNINILGYSNGYVSNKDKVMKNIIKLSPDICLVALGMPLQEELIDKYYKDIKKGIYVSVGGSFDVLSKTKKRAPKIFIKTNTEWLYRIVTEPKRLKRFFKYNVRFLIDMYR